jgi:hypothetical protein
MQGIYLKKLTMQLMNGRFRKLYECVNAHLPKASLLQPQTRGISGAQGVIKRGRSEWTTAGGCTSQRGDGV